MSTKRSEAAACSTPEDHSERPVTDESWSTAQHTWTCRDDCNQRLVAADIYLTDTTGHAVLHECSELEFDPASDRQPVHFPQNGCDVFPPTRPRYQPGCCICILYWLQSLIPTACWWCRTIPRCSSPGDWRWAREPTSFYMGPQTYRRACRDHAVTASDRFRYMTVRCHLKSIDSFPLNVMNCVSSQYAEQQTDATWSAIVIRLSMTTPRSEPSWRRWQLTKFINK